MPDTDTVVVRAATDADAATIAEFNIAMARETENYALDPQVIYPGVRAVLARPEYGFYRVAEINAEVVGCLLITYEWSDWRNGLLWWIQSVYVRQDARRRGVFGSLYASIRTDCAERPDVAGIRLYVEKDNDVAKSTYLGLGMTETDYRLFEDILS